jgi:hypothetical protein
VLQPLLQSYTSSEDYEPLREAAAYVHQVKPFSTRVRRKKVRLLIIWTVHMLYLGVYVSHCESCINQILTKWLPLQAKNLLASECDDLACAYMLCLHAHCMLPALC